MQLHMLRRPGPLQIRVNGSSSSDFSTAGQEIGRAYAFSSTYGPTYTMALHYDRSLNCQWHFLAGGGAGRYSTCRTFIANFWALKQAGRDQLLATIAGNSVACLCRDCSSLVGPSSSFCPVDVAAGNAQCADFVSNSMLNLRVGWSVSSKRAGYPRCLHTVVTGPAHRLLL